MLKVIIADDEERVCQLIVKLIDWEELDMNVVGVAHNGIEAIELTHIHNPDLIITDIRMPGYDGLDMIVRAKSINENIEFIIISGYSQFEYAQKAIRYGVSDYLLKPIKKDELIQTLLKIKESIRQKKGQLSLEEQYELILRNDIDQQRENIFNNFLHNDAIIDDTYFDFKQGYFQTFAIKIDGNIEHFNNNRNVIEKKVKNTIYNKLKPTVYDLETSFRNSTCYSMINYSIENKKAVYKQLISILKEFTRQNVILKEMEFTIGAGKVVSNIHSLHESLETAIWGVEDRIVKGTGKIIEGQTSKGNNLLNSDIIYHFNKDFLVAIERLDQEEVEKSLRSLQENIKREATMSGREVLQIMKEICNLYIFSMRKNKLLVEDSQCFLEKLNVGMNQCNSIDQLFEHLRKIIRASLGSALEDKNLVETRPIRLAKQYIEENYMKAITLEEVGSAIGFNPTYFSSLFKKETGTSFIEYLSYVRIDQAKELLKETNLRVTDICEMVGYSDVKYFTRSFIKRTGLKPNEYRKLYS